MPHLPRHARTRVLTVAATVAAVAVLATPVVDLPSLTADGRVEAAAVAPIQPAELGLGGNSVAVIEATAAGRAELAIRRAADARQRGLADEAQRRRAELVAQRRAEERAREEARREAEARAEAERRAQAAASAPAVASSSVWDRLAACESGGNWASSSGLYEGGLQFHPSTWDAHKPSGYPDAAYQASREQQILVGQRVQAAQGWSAWGSCARKLGLA